MPIVEAHELYRFFHVGDEETAALRGVSLSLDEGEIVALVGPSGSGKSTFLACLTGLDEPDGGWVEVDGRRLTRRSEPERARIRAQEFGILLQTANLFQHLTVAENIEFQLSLARRPNRHRVETLLGAVGLAHRADGYPVHLSGGETARAGLAAALAVDPPILVADEPTAEVDAATEAFLFELFAIRRDDGRATLITTHSAVLAVRADRVIHLHDGRITDG